MPGGAQFWARLREQKKNKHKDSARIIFLLIFLLLMVGLTFGFVR